MEVKRHYKIMVDAEGRPVLKNPAAGVVADNLAQVVSHWEVKHTGASREQNFSDRLVHEGVADGYMVVSGDKLVVKAVPKDLVYDIVREPGYYCKSTGERIPISDRAWAMFKASGLGTETGPEALAWLREQGLFDSDYEVTHAYHCVLEAELHDHFRAVVGAKSRVVAAHVAAADTVTEF